MESFDGQRFWFVSQKEKQKRKEREKRPPSWIIFLEFPEENSKDASGRRYLFGIFFVVARSF